VRNKSLFRFSTIVQFRRKRGRAAGTLLVLVLTIFAGTALDPYDAINTFAHITPPTEENWVAIDCYPLHPGIQNVCGVVEGQPLDVAVTVGNGTGDASLGPVEPAAFNFYLSSSNATRISPTSPGCGGASLDCNPDFNQGALTGGWTCDDIPPLPDVNLDSNPTTTHSRLVCINAMLNGPSIAEGTGREVATVHFNALTIGEATLSLTEVAVGTDALASLASCNPDIDDTGAACSTATVYVVNAVADSDTDGCSDLRELGADWLTGGDRSHTKAFDFFDVPVPALLPGQTTALRNKAVTLADVLAILAYVGTTASDPGNETPSGARYGSDWNNNGLPDGQEYDRGPSPRPDHLWQSEPPTGAVSLQDALVGLAQVGTNCN
jgi:hypothetical protein